MFGLIYTGEEKVLPQTSGEAFLKTNRSGGPAMFTMNVRLPRHVGHSPVARTLEYGQRCGLFDRVGTTRNAGGGERNGIRTCLCVGIGRRQVGYHR